MSICASSTYASNISEPISALLGITASTVGLLVFIAIQRHRDIPYGLLIRVLITLSGSTLAMSPLLHETSAPFVRVITPLVPILSCVAMALLSIEISRETGRGTVDVMPVNYIVYAVFGTAASFLFILLITVLDTNTAWRVAAIVAIICTLLIVPFLPSGSSNAAVFAMNKLPEDEDAKDRTFRTRDAVAAKYGLTKREAQVLLFLLQGKSRNEIAEALGLSTWTVKDYIGEIYSKIGVHTRSELMTLLAGERSEDVHL